MRTLSYWTVPLVLTIAACDDSDGGGSTASVEARLAAAYCDVVERCAAADTAENVLLMLAREASTADCRTFITRALLSGTGFDAKIAAGTYTIDEGKLDACIDEITTSCGLAAGGTCLEAVDGKIAQGGVCTAHEDCDGDAYCAFTGCDGVCQPRVAVGAACATQSECSNGGGTVTCSYVSDKCVAVERKSGVAAGGVCGETDDGAKVTIARCATGLACTLASDEAEEFTCVAPVALGGACTDDNTPCALGSVCLPNAEGEGGTCKAFPIANNVGDACNEEFGEPDAVFCNPVLFLGCQAGKCEKAGDGSVGARCFNQDVGGHCDAGNYCDSASNTCAVAKANDAPCEDNDECASDNCEYDNEGNGKCAPAFCGE